jgi:hypothetical protein
MPFINTFDKFIPYLILIGIFLSIKFKNRLGFLQILNMEGENMAEKSYEEMIPVKTYSNLHYRVLEADAWAHKIGVKTIALNRGWDWERELRIEGLMNACFEEFERYNKEERSPDVALHGDLVYAMRIMAKIAGPNENVVTLAVGDKSEQKHSKSFGFDLIKKIADIYNNSAGVGEQIQRVQLEYYKGDEERGEIKTAYAALNRDELIFEEVA